MSLDSILNVLVPIIIVGGLLILIYSKAKGPIDTFFAKIRDLIIRMQEGKEEEKEEGEYLITYRGAEY